MVSMKDIARECNVSVATVSKALNGQPDIGPETRERIARKAEEMGYMANSAARALKTNRTYNIGVLFVNSRNGGLAHEFFSMVLDGIRERAEEAGYDLSKNLESNTITIAKYTVPVSLVFLTLCGLCTSVMWGSIFNLSTEGLGKYTAPASGIFMTLVCGGGIIPFLQNLLADKVGSIPSYWLLVACLAFLLFYGLAGHKNVNKDIPVE